MTASLSRFAVLRIDDDEDEKAAQRARDKQRAAAQKLLPQNKSKEEKARLNADKNATRKTKAAQEKAEVITDFILYWLAWFQYIISPIYLFLAESFSLWWTKTQKVIFLQKETDNSCSGPC